MTGLDKEAEEEEEENKAQNTARYPDDTHHTYKALSGIDYTTGTRATAYPVSNPGCKKPMSLRLVAGFRRLFIVSSTHAYGPLLVKTLLIQKKNALLLEVTAT